jgi:hypothetical protein
MGHKLNKIKQKRSVRAACWLLSTLFITPVVMADNKDQNDIPWYQIEVIVFANQSYLGIASETWPDDEPINATDLIELKHHDDNALAQTMTRSGQSKTAANQPAANTPVPYELLDPSQLQLTPVEKKLAASSKYKPLLHIAWRQPTLSPEQAKPVFVYYGMEQAPDPMAASRSAKQSQIVMRGQNQSGGRFTAVPMGAFSVDDSQYGELLPATEADTLVGPLPNPLFGILRLSVSRYLHLDANLNYRIPVMKEEVVPMNPEDQFGSTSFGQGTSFNSPTSSGESTIIKRQVLQNFNLKETRRMRSKEIHYFDNPVIGIIVRVIPFEIPKIEPAFDPASQAFKSGTSPPAKTPPR